MKMVPDEFHPGPFLLSEQHCFRRLHRRIDRDDRWDACHFKHILHFRNGVEQDHPPAAARDRFSGQHEQADADGGEEVHLGKVHDDEDFISRAVTRKFGFDLARAEDVQPAFEFDQTDAVAQFAVIEFHDFSPVRCDGVIILTMWEIRVNNRLWFEIKQGTIAQIISAEREIMTNLCFLPATELARLLRTKAISAREVLSAHLEQIQRVNPKVNAIITLVAEQALEAAKRADESLVRGEILGPLHGLLVAHKDLQPTRGIRTTFGSPIYRDFVPNADSLVVERIKRAGAVAIGKTNTPEFGAGSQTFNPVFGATRNPYDLSKTSGGSSGGAAAALACGMIPLADGSDMGGSLRNPANFCNVVGLRPSPGRVPSHPNELGWFTLSVDGPMARTVADAALLLSVLAGRDDRSPIALSDAGSSFALPLGRDFKGTRLAWVDLGLPYEAEVKRVVDSTRSVFESLGCVVEDAEPDFSDADEIFKAWRAWSFEAGLASEYQEHKDQLKDTVVWNIEQGMSLTGPYLARLEMKRTQLYHRLREFMQTYEFLILPVSQVLPFDVEQPYPTRIDDVEMLTTYIDWMKSCYYISTVGHPALSVPGGFTASGLPVGVQIVGRHRDDWGVLQLGHAFEQATQHWKHRPSVAS